jgi:formamidopyrimidine-DNA glycosylase
VPELPEVETVARDLRPGLTGARFSDVRVPRPNVLRDVSAPALARALRGRRVVEVGRRAKHLVILLDDGRRLVIHLRMTGSLHIGTTKARDPYGVLEVGLGARGRLVFRDVRRLGTVHLMSPDRWAAHAARIGPEPLARSFTADALGDVLRGRRLAIKKALMDQRVLAGVGNIYANEALWLARIDPSRPAHGLTRAEVVRLHRAVVGVLRRAVAGRGTTVRDYRTGTGEPGNFQGRLAVYERAGEPCLACGRHLALTHAIDARATYFCPWCQS